MKEGQTDFLDDFVDEPAPAAQPAAEPPPADANGQPRDDMGRFAPKAEASEPVQQGVKPETPPASGTEPPSAEEGHNVPRAALEAERKKRQQLEARLAELERQRQAPPSPPAQQQVEEQYDFEEDPANYLRSAVEQTQQNQFNQRLDFSEMAARSQAGDEPVDQALEAFKQFAATDPTGQAVWNNIIAARHPYGELLKWHKRQADIEQLLTVGGLDKLREQIAAELRQSGVQPPAAAQRQPPPKPMTPPSLADGGAGQATAPEFIDEDADFDAFFAGARKPRKR